MISQDIPNSVGSFLTDTDLRPLLTTAPEAVGVATLHVCPFSEESLTPAGYDLRVGTRCTSKRKARTVTGEEGDTFDLPPYDTCLIETLETIGMPRDRSLTGMIVSTVTMASRGLSHISTSVDADWSGRLLIVVHNHSSSALKLKVGERLCTLMLFTNRSASTKLCGVFDGRDDIFRKQFIQEGRREIRSRRLLRWLPLSIIPASVLIGFLIFGNESGLSAVTAGGVALFGFVNAYLQERHSSYKTRRL